MRGPWQTASDSIRVTWVEAEAGVVPALGERWRVRGVVRAPGALSRSTLLQLRATAADAAFLGAAAGHPLRRWCERGRAACAAVLGRGLEDFSREAGMLRALVLGYRQELPPELFQAFSRTGTLHVIAVSGSHVAIFAGIVVALLKAGGLTRTRWILVLAPALVWYSMSTGLAPSAIRACIMALVFWSATLFQRRPDGPTALGLAAIVILLVQPEQILDAGFVLSFLAVAGLMLFYPPLRRLLAPAPAAGTESRPAWQAPLRSGSHALRQLLAASIAAWLVTTPLTMWYFHLFSPSGLLLNLAVIPISGAILFAGTLALFFAPFSLFLSEVVNHAARLLVQVMIALVDHVDRWPGSHFYVETPSAWFLAGWGLALVAAFFGGPRLRRMTLAVVLASMAWSLRGQALDHRVRGVVWSREGCLAALLRLPGGGDVLIDAGRTFQGREIVQQLRREGVDRLAVVIVTRSRADAAGGLPAILQEVPLGAVWCADGGGRSPALDAALAEAERRGIAVRHLRPGDTGSWAGDVAWRVLGTAGTAGSLDLLIARGPASIRWSGAAAAELVDRPATLWFAADGVCPTSSMARIVTPTEDALSARAGTAIRILDGDALRCRMADDRAWRAPAPGIEVD